MSKLVEAIFNTIVTPDLLGEVVEMLADLEQDERNDLTGRSVAIIQLLNDKEEAQVQPHLVAAIDFRLNALAKLSGKQELRAWSIPGDVAGMIRIDPLVLQVAASQPLIAVNDHEVEFEAEAFFKCLLELTEEKGHG